MNADREDPGAAVLEIIQDVARWDDARKYWSIDTDEVVARFAAWTLARCQKDALKEGRAFALDDDALAWARNSAEEFVRKQICFRALMSAWSQHPEIRTEGELEKHFAAHGGWPPFDPFYEIEAELRRARNGNTKS